MKKVSFMKVDQGTRTLVDGYKLEYRGINLVVHRTPQGWGVSEPRTGFCIVRDEPLRIEAMNAAVMRIDAVGVDNTKVILWDSLSGMRTIP